MFPSQMARLKILESSSGPLCPCFLHKWHALKLSNPQVVHFVHVSLANGTRFKIVEPSSGPLCPCFPRKWYVLKLSNPAVIPLCPCFPRKWYALKLSNPQVVHFDHVSLTNGMP